MHYPATVPLPPVSAPRVVTLHDVQHLDAPQHVGRLRKHWRQGAYDRAAQRADVVITVSNHAREQIVYHLGIAPDRVRTIYHGVDPAVTPSDPNRGVSDDVLARIGLEQPFVLYPAGLWPHKNHDALLEALRHVNTGNLQLVLTGPTFQREQELRRQIERQGLAGRVRHLGFVPRATLVDLYRHAEALVFPSLYEGFGYPPLEAMAAGCPVLVSNSTSLPEVCGDAALYFSPRAPLEIASAIDLLLGDDALRARLIDEGFRQAAKFSWERSAQEHVSAYAEALG